MQVMGIRCVQIHVCNDISLWVLMLITCFIIILLIFILDLIVFILILVVMFIVGVGNVGGIFSLSLLIL